MLSCGSGKVGFNTGNPFIPETIPPTQILEYTVFGVLPEITGATPSLMVLDADGYLTQDTTINYSIQPSEYNAIIADIDIYERPAGSTNPDDDEYAFSLIGDKTQGDGTAIIYEGEYFDITKEYYAEVVLNRGSEVEIVGDRVPLPLAQFEIIEPLPGCNQSESKMASALQMSEAIQCSNVTIQNDASGNPQMPPLTTKVTLGTNIDPIFLQNLSVCWNGCSPLRNKKIIHNEGLTKY